MLKKVMVKKVFPGGNTTKGFYSYYDNIIEENANRVFILKGGPGVGKSSFMKKVEREMLGRGYSVEEHYCSSANGALDAIVIPDLKVAFLDGTSPHIVDPKNPGAVDEIVDLGDYWDQEGIKRCKEEILLLNKEVGKCFTRVYRYLKILDPIIQDISMIYKEGMDVLAYNKLQQSLFQEIFKDPVMPKKLSSKRHLFGSGITPEGVVDYLETIIEPMKNIYYVKGNWGTGWAELLQEVSRKAIVLGYDVEVYHTPLAPEKIADIIIPELSIGITTSKKFSNKCTQLIDLDKLVDKNILKKYEEELKFAEKMYEQLLEQSIYYINKAKLAHDKLESFYISNMNFDKVNEKREKIINTILNMK